MNKKDKVLKQLTDIADAAADKDIGFGALAGAIATLASFSIPIRADCNVTKRKMTVYVKRKVTILKIITPLLMLFCACNNKPSNLIFNGSAEIPRYDSVPKGWQNIQGRWVSAEGDSAHHDYAHAEDSNHYFFGGYGLICLLQQDVDVSKYAKEIDEKKQLFIVSGFEQTLDQGPLSDQGMFKVACLDVSKNKMLYSDSSDTLMSKTRWQAVADTFSAPPSTRFIRVQLIAFRHVGGDNDGYFDNISLVAVPSSNYLLIIIIIAAIIIMAGLAFYFRKRKLANQHKIKINNLSS